MPTCCKHSQDEYTDTFASLFSIEGCHVAAHVIINSLKLRDENLERLRQNASKIFINSQKPSLTRILEQKMLTEGALNTSESFQAFCRATRLPSNASTYIKRLCYYALCLLYPPTNTTSTTTTAAFTHNNHTNTLQKNSSYTTTVNYNKEIHDFLRRVVCNDPIVLAALQNIGTVINPDATVLCAFLSEVQHTCEPSNTLKLFRQKCILGNSRGMNWTTVLRLYLASYCHSATLVKELWSHVLNLAAASRDGNDASSASSLSVLMMSGGSSMEVEAAIQTFVQETPPALMELLPTLINI